MASSDLLDLITLQNLVDLDDGHFGLISEMIGIFRDDTPGRIEGILEAAARMDVEDFSRAAHALKGGAGALGAKALRAMAADLENLGRGGSVDAGEDLAARLQACFRASLAALGAYVREGKNRQGQLG